MSIPIKIGDKFGRLEVKEKSTVKGCDRSYMWSCLCDCGKIKLATSHHLKTGGVQSCGCLLREGNNHRTHGESQTAEYFVWLGMKSRCTNPNHDSYPYYGGRGISISPEWENFEVFLSDVGLRPSPLYTLARKKVNGDYEPGNVTWATKKEQANNRRNKRLDQFPLEELRKELERRQNCGQP